MSSPFHNNSNKKLYFILNERFQAKYFTYQTINGIICLSIDK